MGRAGRPTGIVGHRRTRLAMALATRCPHCETIFRVASDQLKLRAGLVRCGTCKEIFNGIENLQHPEVGQPVSNEPVTPHLADMPVAEGGADLTTSSPTTDTGFQEAEKVVESIDMVNNEAMLVSTFNANPEEETPASDLNDESPLLRDVETVVLGLDAQVDETLPSITDNETDPVDQALSLDAEKDDLPEQDDGVLESGLAGSSPDQPSAAPTAGPTDEVPEFVKRVQNRSGRAGMVRMASKVAVAVFLLGLASQTIYAFRSTLAANFPQIRPQLESACRLIGCRVALPMQIDALSIESSDFQPITGNREQFVLYVLLRSRSSTTQAWPCLELTLTDTNDKPLASRVIMPKDYLPVNSSEKDGFAAGAEQSVKLYFSLPQLKAAGYRVYLFYP